MSPKSPCLDRTKLASRNMQSSAVIWPQTPFQILAMNQDSILGHQQHELNGNIALKLTGPLSDSALFQQAVINTWSLQSTRIQLILYDRDHNAQQVILSCSPLLSEGVFIGCLAVFKPSQAISLDKAHQTINEWSCAQCLVSADPPHAIQKMNDAFVTNTRCPRDFVFGKPMPLLASVHSCSPGQWSALLLEAAHGAIQRRSSSMHCRVDKTTLFQEVIETTPFEEVIFVPVAEAPNGRIRHVLVIFPPANLPAPTSPAALSSLGPEGHRHLVQVDETVNIQAVPGPAVACDPRKQPVARGLEAADDLRGPGAAGLPHVSPPAAAKAAPAVLPRRRPASVPDGSAPAPAVVLTPALLDSLRGRPLPCAARAVGV